MIEFELEFASSIHINFFKEERVFQIIFPMPLGTEIDKVKAAMPVGWTVEEVGEGWLNIRNRMNDSWVGVIKVQPEKIAIRVPETDPQGEAFWRAFGMRYPVEFDPFDLRFGVIYLGSDEKTGKYGLDELPKHDPMDQMTLAHYTNSNAYYVTFRLGDWHAGEKITVQSAQMILHDGKLGPKRKNLFFPIGKMENENTM